MKEALKGTDTEAIKSASGKLNEAWQAVSAELYKAAQQGGAPGAGPQPGASEPGGGTRTESAGGGSAAGGKDEGPIIDAEVVDDNKR